jgi:hypothetical protein
MPDLEDEQAPRSAWQPIYTAPFDRDLELAVIDGAEAVALLVPSRRAASGWINARTGKVIDVSPSHWRRWWREA